MKRLKNLDHGMGFLPARCMPVLGLLMGLSACGRLTDPPPAAAPSPPAWNWLDFPRADRLTLAQVSAVIEPAHVEVVKAPREGWFELAPGLQGSKDKDEPAAANQIIGRMAPGTESLEAEGELLHQQLAEVEAQLRLIHEAEAVEAFAEQERRARQDIKTYEAALALANDPALAKDPTVRRDVLPQADSASRQEIDRLQASLEAAKGRLEKTRAAGEKQAALQKRQTELADAKAAFERRQKTERDQIKAPFAGQIRFVVSFETKPEPKPEAQAQVAPTPAAPTPAAPAPATLRAYVRAEAVIGVLRDHSAFWAKVEVADPSVLSVPANQLLFSFTSGAQTVEAAFGGRAPEGGGGTVRIAPVYQFGIAEPTPDIIRLAGGEVNGKLVQKLAQSAYVVPKVRLYTHWRDAFADGAWERNCARVFPGCQVLAVGRDEVALVPPEVLDAAAEAKK